MLQVWCILNSRSIRNVWMRCTTILIKWIGRRVGRGRGGCAFMFGVFANYKLRYDRIWLNVSMGTNQYRLVMVFKKSQSYISTSLKLYTPHFVNRQTTILRYVHACCVEPCSRCHTWSSRCHTLFNPAATIRSTIRNISLANDAPCCVYRSWCLG